jgi:hypothetical protein
MEQVFAGERSSRLLTIALGAAGALILLPALAACIGSANC